MAQPRRGLARTVSVPHREQWAYHREQKGRGIVVELLSQPSRSLPARLKKEGRLSDSTNQASQP